MSSIAIVVGRASGVWEELAAARALAPNHVLFAVGRVGVDLDCPIAHWASWHPDLLRSWAGQRVSAGLPLAEHHWTGVSLAGSMMRRGWSRKNYHPELGHYICRWNPTYRRRDTLPQIDFNLLDCPGGSSGLLATLAARLKGYKVILAGVPMDRHRGHYDQAGEWSDAEALRKVWKKEAPKWAGSVRSLSGWTAELLGEPSAAWVNE